MISARNIDEAIFELKLFIEISKKYAGEILDELKKAVSKSIPDVKTKFLDGDPGKLFFECDDFEFEATSSEDIEKNYKTLSEVIVEVFPELDGLVYDDRIFLNRRLQAKIKKSLKDLKERGEL